MNADDERWTIKSVRDIPTGDQRLITPINAKYLRDVLVTVLIYHQRRNIESCLCGWSVWGASHSEHVADVYEQAMWANIEHICVDGGPWEDEGEQTR